MTSFVLGIDAGGTSVRAALAPADDPCPLDVLTLTAPAAPDGGPEPLHALLPALLDRAGLGAVSVRAACAGIAKITRGDTQTRWQAALSERLSSARVSVVPDFEIAFHGAIARGTGLAVIAGTGSVAYGVNGAGMAARVGGRGWEFGDEGSGSWLTAEMLRRTMRALDGLEIASDLTFAVCKTLGTDDPARLGERAREAIAEQGRGFLVPLLLEHARQGDGEATNLYVGAGGWLAALARAGLKRLELSDAEAFTVATVGGLWQADDLLLVPFTRVLHRWYPQAQVQIPGAPPLTGALRLAARNAALGQAD